jgi:hypothetical protein
MVKATIIFICVKCVTLYLTVEVRNISGEKITHERAASTEREFLHTRVAINCNQKTPLGQT